MSSNDGVARGATVCGVHRHGFVFRTISRCSRMLLVSVGPAPPHARPCGSFANVLHSFGPQQPKERCFHYLTLLYIWLDVQVATPSLRTLCMIARPFKHTGLLRNELPERCCIATAVVMLCCHLQCQIAVMPDICGTHSLKSVCYHRRSNTAEELLPGQPSCRQLSVWSVRRICTREPARPTALLVA